MLTSPYKVIIVPPIGAEPSDEQMAWMNRRLRMLGTSAVSMGLTGNCVHVFVYPMKRGVQDLPRWAAHWRRPEHSVINRMLTVYAYDTRSMKADPMSLHVMRECLSWDADEVWCLNAAGHGQMSPSPAARVWRHAQAGNLPSASRFKLVPSWVDSNAPEKPAKERKDGKTDGNKRGSSAPASGAGGGRGERSAKGPTRSPWGVPRTRY